MQIGLMRTTGAFRRLTLFVMVTILLAISSPRVEAAPTPTLDINQLSFCTDDPNWLIHITTAEPNSTITLNEYFNSGSGTWTLIWSGNIGLTDHNGERWYSAPAPIYQGQYYAEVVVAGETSNRIIYWASHC